VREDSHVLRPLLALEEAFAHLERDASDNEESTCPERDASNSKESEESGGWCPALCVSCEENFSSGPETGACCNSCHADLLCNSDNDMSLCKSSQED